MNTQFERCYKGNDLLHHAVKENEGWQIIVLDICELGIVFDRIYVG